MGVLLALDRAEIEALMSPADHLAASKEAFRALGDGKAELPPPMHLHGDGGGFHAKGAVLRSAPPYAAVKVNGNFPGNRERFALPTIQGAILLFDAERGTPLALFDSIAITLARTAASTALAATFLARRDARALTICGCGDQAQAQLEALMDVIPVEQVHCWDAAPHRAAQLAKWVMDRFGTSVGVPSAMRDATRTSDIIVTCTTSSQAFLGPEDVAPGTFIAAVGADSPTKQEIAPALFDSASIYVDDLDQCLAMGDLRHAIQGGKTKPDRVAASLADLVCGLAPGRRGDSEITLFDSTGLAIQDVTAAVAVYTKAKSAGAGVELRL